MKRRDFMATGGGFVGLSLARFDQVKEGKMQKESAPDPKEVFLARISKIREKFQECFNKGDWQNMEKLYWEKAVLISEKTNKVFQGPQEIVKFWAEFKEQKEGRMLTSAKPMAEKPPLRPVDLIEIVAMGEYNIYDIEAVDICEYVFNPDLSSGKVVVTYRHKKTCTTAIYQETTDLM